MFSSFAVLSENLAPRPWYLAIYLCPADVELYRPALCLVRAGWLGCASRPFSQVLSPGQPCPGHFAIETALGSPLGPPQPLTRPTGSRDGAGFALSPALSGCCHAPPAPHHPCPCSPWPPGSPLCQLCCELRAPARLLHLWLHPESQSPGSHSLPPSLPSWTSDGQLTRTSLKGEFLTPAFSKWHCIHAEAGGPVGAVLSLAQPPGSRLIWGLLCPPHPRLLLHSHQDLCTDPEGAWTFTLPLAQPAFQWKVGKPRPTQTPPGASLSPRTV